MNKYILCTCWHQCIINIFTFTTCPHRNFSLNMFLNKYFDNNYHLFDQENMLSLMLVYISNDDDITTWLLQSTHTCINWMLVHMNDDYHLITKLTLQCHADTPTPLLVMCHNCLAYQHMRDNYGTQWYPTMPYISPIIRRIVHWYTLLMNMYRRRPITYNHISNWYQVVDT